MSQWADISFLKARDTASSTPHPHLRPQREQQPTAAINYIFCIKIIKCIEEEEDEEKRKRAREREREKPARSYMLFCLKLFYSYIPSPGDEKRTALQPSLVALSLSLPPLHSLSFSPFSLSLSVDMYDGHKSNKLERVWCRRERGKKKKKKAS